MIKVQKNRRKLQLLALGFAALFLVAQTQASTHFHRDDNNSHDHAECEICIVSSQLDDAISADIEQCNRSLPLVSTTLRHERTFLLFIRANTTARAPPVS